MTDTHEKVEVGGENERKLEDLRNLGMEGNRRGAPFPDRLCGPGVAAAGTSCLDTWVALGLRF